MHRNKQKLSAREGIIGALLLLNVVIMQEGYISNTAWYKAMWITLPLLALAFFVRQRKPQ